MAEVYLAKAQMAVEQAESRGAGMSEAYISAAKELNIEIGNQQVEAMKMAEEQGIGVRVMINGKIGFAYSSDLKESSIKNTVEQALANARQTCADKFNVLPHKSKYYKEMDLVDEAILSTPIEEKIILAKNIEKEARAFDSRVKITESTTYQDATFGIAVFNSLGVAESYEGAYCGAYAYLVAEENGESQTGFDLDFSLKYAELNPAKIGREAARKAVRMLGAKSIATQKATVVLDPYVATNFLGVLAPALSAEAVQKGKSVFAGKVGTKISSPAVTIIDDGALPGAVASSPFDGEGVATSETVLIKEGLLQGFLHNSYTAAKDGIVSTGNGIRGTFKGTPEVGPTNFYIKPGAVTREQLLKGIVRGLYVTEIMGMHTANPISGDFSVGAAGILIENGILSTPVRGIAIAGNILDLLKSIDLVSDDLTFFVGRGSPTVRIAQMTISGS